MTSPKTHRPIHQRLLELYPDDDALMLFLGSWHTELKAYPVEYILRGDDAPIHSLLDAMKPEHGHA